MKQFRQKELSVLIKAAATVAICLGVVACGGGGGGGGTTDNTNNTNNTPTPTKTNYSQAFQEASRSAPLWTELAEIKKEEEVVVPGSKIVENELVGSDSILSQCTTEKVSLTANPKRLVMLDPQSGLWLGGLFQSKPYLQGTFTELVIKQRAPITISIDKLVLNPNTNDWDKESMKLSETVVNPDKDTVFNAINRLANKVALSTSDLSSKVHYTEVESFSSEQTALKLGISAKFASGSVKANLSQSRTKNEHQLSAHFVEQMFVVTMNTFQTPGNFFTSDLTKEMLDVQIAQKSIAPDNPPVYISSIVFGRVLNFNMSSSYSKDEMKAALEAANNALVNRTKLDVESKAAKVLSSSSITVTAIGGPTKDTTTLIKYIKEGNLTEYFNGQGVSISTAVPLSYEFKTLKGEPAGFSESTEYNVTECKSGAKQTLTRSIHSPTLKTNSLTGVRSNWDSGWQSYTLDQGSYFTKNHNYTTTNGSGATGACKIGDYSNYEKVTLKDGTVVSNPRTISYKTEATSPSGHGNSGWYQCSFNFDYVQAAK